MGFRVPFFDALERRDWWWRANVFDRMVFLVLFRLACERDGTAWIGGRALSSRLGPKEGDGGGYYTHDEVIAAYARLEDVGALKDVSDPATERWHYRIVDFEELANAAHTYRAKYRDANRRRHAKQEVA